MYRVVFDTNVLLSAFIFGGNPEKVFELGRAGKIRLLTSPSILAEFAGRLKDKFLWDDDDIAEAIRIIGYSTELIKPSRTLAVVGDESDNRVLECAVEGAADFIVSGDKHLLDLTEFEHVPVVRAAELVVMVSNGMPRDLSEGHDDYLYRPRERADTKSIFLDTPERPTAFVEVCAYDVKPDKTEEFERLVQRVARHHGGFPGVRDVRYVRRTHRQDNFSAVKEGRPPMRLTRAPKSVTYVLYWEMDNEVTHGAATKSGLERFFADFRKCLVSTPRIILGERIG